MSRYTEFLKVLAINIAVFVIAAEIGLRLIPATIPETLLKRFEPSLRASIAERRSLPNVSDVVHVQRDDGGPPLLIFKPNEIVHFFSRENGKSGKIHMDDRGFCNPEGTIGYDGTVDVVVAGDSFTACQNEPPDSTAPESYVNWPFVFGRLAGKSVYNLSRGGDGIYEYIQLVKHVGTALRPQLVIIQMYEGNDLRDAQRYHAFKQLTPEERANVPLRASWEPYKVSYKWLLQNWLAEHSYAFNFIIVGGTHLISTTVEQIWRIAGSDSLVDFRFWLNFEHSRILMNPDNDDRDEVRTARSTRTGDFSFSLFDEALETYSRLARENAFTPVLSYAPAAHVAYESLVNFEDPHLKELMLWYSQAQRSYVGEKCKELGIIFIDLTPALKNEIGKQGLENLLYYPSNIHFTVFGHKIIAQELVRFLIDMKSI